jgi:hypothetical protein
MEKELENSEKKKRRKQPSRPNLAQPGRAPAPPDRRTPHVSGSSLSRAPSLPRSLPSGASLSALVFFPARSLSLCLAGPVRQSSSRCPARPFLLSRRRGPYLSVLPPPRSPWTGTCALAHITGVLGHDAHPRAQCPCPISLIAPYARPISPSPVLCRGGPPCSCGGRPI